MNDGGRLRGHVCSACGACAAVCPDSLAEMRFDPVRGTFVPSIGVVTCANGCGLCAAVCPLAGQGPSARDLNKSLYGGSPDTPHDAELGFFRNSYVGYSEAHRLRSASGGLLTWVGEQLLKTRSVTGVICVVPDEAAPTRFRFTIARTLSELHAASGSCYQPVHAADVLKQVQSDEGEFALVGLPCLAAATRLAQRSNPALRSRIRYVLSVVCGGMRTKHFVDYVSAVFMGAVAPFRVEFRAKWPDQLAQSRFRFHYRTPDGGVMERRAVFAGAIGPVWGSSLFASDCRAACDDAFALAADAVFMDAWLPEYGLDWRGHTIALVRHPEIDEILRAGALSGARIAPIAPADVIRSQAALIRERRVRRFLKARAAGVPLDGGAPGVLDRMSIGLQDVIRSLGATAWRATLSYRAVHAAVWLPTLALRLCNFVRGRMGVLREAPSAGAHGRTTICDRS